MEQSNNRSKQTEADELPLFIKWIDFLKWLLTTTEKFPKSVRFTFIDRIHHLALGAVEELIEARYSRDKRGTLLRLNIKIEKIRVLLRICYEQKYLPHKAYQHSIFSLNEVGKMVGGWIKQQEKGK